MCGNTVSQTHSLAIACEIGKARRIISHILQKKERIMISQVLFIVYK